jgi:hypothetical protein
VGCEPGLPFGRKLPIEPFHPFFAARMFHIIAGRPDEVPFLVCTILPVRSTIGSKSGLTGTTPPKQAVVLVQPPPASIPSGMQTARKGSMGI